MAALFASGRVIDLILVLTVLEAAALTLFHRRTGRGIAPRDFLLNLASGMALLLAVRCALAGSGWTLVALCLLLALGAHLGDIGARLARRGGGNEP